MQNNHADMSQASNRSSAINASDLSQFTWPAEMKLVLSSGLKKMRLLDHNDLISSVIHNVMGLVHADLSFHSAYPDHHYFIVIIMLLSFCAVPELHLRGQSHCWLICTLGMCQSIAPEAISIILSFGNLVCLAQFNQ